MRVVRPTVLALAIVLCAWFVVGIRQAHEINQASALIAKPQGIGAARLRHTASLLDSAGFLNPDAEVDILRGRLAIAEHRFRRAEQILGAVTRREPMNLEAWIWMTGAALTDPRQAQIALAHIRALDPRA